MPIADISTTQFSLIGICCMKGKQREQLKSEWDSRFNSRSAFWVDADMSDGLEKVRDAVRTVVKEQSIIGLPHQQCILAVFLDLQEPLADPLPDTLWQLRTALDMIYGSNTLLLLQFGYVGIRGLSDAATARNNAARIVAENQKQHAAIQHRLCLVGSTDAKQGREKNWRAVAVLLDVLRRQTSLNNMLPASPNGMANDDVGFLRYGEYDKDRYEKLLTQREDLLKLLGDSGGEALNDLLTAKRDALRQQIKDEFQIRASLQPQHPEVILEPGILKSNIKKARKGKHKEYNYARSQTQTAVELTGSRMEKEIGKRFEPHIRDAYATLEYMLRKASVGIKLKANKVQMDAMLSSTNISSGNPQKPQLNYDEAGCVDEISTYLTDKRSYAIDKHMAKFDAEIRAAYEKIFAQGFDEEQKVLERQLQKVEDEIAGMETPESLCVTISTNGYLPECDLNPQNIFGSQVGYLLFRGSDMQNIIGPAMAGGFSRVYEISEKGGGLETLDNAPAKAVQLTVFDCNDEVLNSMMPWR